MIGAVVVVLVAFASMELFTYLAHRFVMHGLGMVLHRSHHRTRPGRFEANDLFPVTFASITIVAMAYATASLSTREPLLYTTIGVTLYGMAYLFVHDLYIHRRLPLVKRDIPVLEHLRAAHRIHHQFGGEPYGMLFPIVPAELRERAAHPLTAA